MPESTVVMVICSTLSLRADVDKELTPLIILFTKTLSLIESPVDELRRALQPGLVQRLHLCWRPYLHLLFSRVQNGFE